MNLGLSARDVKVVAGFVAAMTVGSGVVWLKGGPSLNESVLRRVHPRPETVRIERLIRPVDLNAASAAELERLPGIGPALADRIIEDRTKHGPYRTIEMLDRVPGIGPKTVARLAPYLKVDQANKKK